jgi:hypothetical protein
MEIKQSIRNQVYTLTLNRPEVFNSFNHKMAFALQDALKAAASNEDVRAIVITGEGKAFCAGQDLAEATDPNGPALQSIVKDHYNPIIELIRTIEKPIIAAVNCQTFSEFHSSVFQNRINSRFRRNVFLAAHYRFAKSHGFDDDWRQNCSRRSLPYEYDIQSCGRRIV